MAGLLIGLASAAALTRPLPPTAGRTCGRPSSRSTGSATTSTSSPSWPTAAPCSRAISISPSSKSSRRCAAGQSAEAVVNDALRARLGLKGRTGAPGWSIRVPIPKSAISESRRKSAPPGPPAARRSMRAGGRVWRESTQSYRPRISFNQSGYQAPGERYRSRANPPPIGSDLPPSTAAAGAADPSGGRPRVPGCVVVEEGGRGVRQRGPLRRCRGAARLRRSPMIPRSRCGGDRTPIRAHDGERMVLIASRTTRVVW